RKPQRLAIGDEWRCLVTEVGRCGRLRREARLGACSNQLSEGCQIDMFGDIEEIKSGERAGANVHFDISRAKLREFGLLEVLSPISSPLPGSDRPSRHSR